MSVRDSDAAGRGRGGGFAATDFSDRLCGGCCGAVPSRDARVRTCPSPIAGRPRRRPTARANFINWMVENRGEDPKYLGQRWDRYQVLVANRDVGDDANKRAFLMTPREEFVLQARTSTRAYDHAFLDIGFGVTISGPHLVGRMTSAIDVQAGREGARDRHRLRLPVGLSRQPHRQGVDDRDHQAARRAHARHLRRADRARLHRVSGRSPASNADGYYGWEEAAPFDKIIVTCGIDHIPPPLLQQLKAGGIMVIPVGPPGAQHVLKVVKTAGRRRHDHASPAPTSTTARSCRSCRSPSSKATRSRARISSKTRYTHSSSVSSPRKR